MKILLKKVRIIDKNSIYNNQQKDILVSNGVIEEIADEILDDFYDEVFYLPNCHISIGWFDFSCHLKDPGFENLETLETLQEAALNGGFTALAGFPNTNPTVQTKESIAYFANFSKRNLLTIYNFGAVSKNCEGKDFTDMMDLHYNGAVGFSDGTETIQSSDIFLKALQYISPLNSILVHKSEDKYLSMFGQMHEGKTSTMIGLKGIPSASEEICITRDLQLLAYAGIKSESSLLHFSTISSAGSVKIIREAKAKGLPVSCDIAAHQLVFTDEDLSEFDTNLKVKPPFRGNDDLDEIVLGLSDGTIDTIVSDHNPLNEELKNIEFDLADFGIIGLQTAFSAINMYSDLSLGDIIYKLSQKPRELLKLEIPKIEEGAEANLTLFDPDQTYKLEIDKIASLSKNSPFIGKELHGRALAVLNNKQFKKL